MDVIYLSFSQVSVQLSQFTNNKSSFVPYLAGDIEYFTFNKGKKPSLVEIINF